MTKTEFFEESERVRTERGEVRFYGNKFCFQFANAIIAYFTF